MNRDFGEGKVQHSAIFSTNGTRIVQKRYTVMYANLLDRRPSGKTYITRCFKISQKVSRSDRVENEMVCIMIYDRYNLQIRQQRPSDALVINVINRRTDTDASSSDSQSNHNTPFMIRL